MSMGLFTWCDCTCALVCVTLYKEWVHTHSVQLWYVIPVNVLCIPIHINSKIIFTPNCTMWTKHTKSHRNSKNNAVAFTKIAPCVLKPEINFAHPSQPIISHTLPDFKFFLIWRDKTFSVRKSNVAQAYYRIKVSNKFRYPISFSGISVQAR